MPACSKGGQDIAIELEEMMFEFSPGLLTTVSNVVTAFTTQRKVCFLLCFSPLSPNIARHILLIVLHIYLMGLVGRISINIETCYLW